MALENTCQACEDLKNISTNVVINGITETECNSLKKNYGLNQNLPVLHNNCDDLNTLLNCLLGNLQNELLKYNTCDWKKFNNDLMTNLYNIIKAMQCGDCGQWNEINLLWEETEKLWRETEKLWNETEKLWAETQKIWAEIYKMWAYIYALEQRIVSLENRVSSLEIRVTSLEARMTIVENRITLLENRITNIEGDVSTIKDQITEIYELIDAIALVLNQETTNLVYNTDFTIEYHNMFEHTDSPPLVSIIDTDFSLTIRISAGSAEYIRNTNINAIVLRHGNSAASTPASWILTLNFIGAYSWINTFTFTAANSIQIGSGIWNCGPSSERGRWQVNTAINRNVTGANGFLLLSAVNINDGYNENIYGRNEGLEGHRNLNSTTQNLNIGQELVLAKPL